MLNASKCLFESREMFSFCVCAELNVKFITQRVDRKSTLVVSASERKDVSFQRAKHKVALNTAFYKNNGLINVLT